MTAAPLAPTRPVVRYYGGKFRLAQWIVDHFPPHRVYVESFAGAASVLLRKPRAAMDVYNDLDENIVNLFRVLRDPEQSAALLDRLRLTPYARAEHETAMSGMHEGPIDRAWVTVVRGMMGHGSRGATSRHRTGFRTAIRSGFSPATDWTSYVDALPLIVARLRGVLIEQKPALEVARRYDADDTLHYFDPPYLASVRFDFGGGRTYRHELTDEQHVELAGEAHRLRGFVIVSGYPSPLYDELYRGWERHQADVFSDGRQPRSEVLWLSPACSAALRATRSQGSLEGMDAL